ncbi:MAG TPA: isocitrate lyase/phosphoenolpyruvate mutase family protein [Solirubrobacteraceae bacterium]|nr:isocitrate lyase/phosphoenolpyruvate mutase family protein [Solirubrobacteraceae bacterium]
MDDRAGRAQRFLELHRSEAPLLLPNPWDVGSAVLLASLGFKALATTSSGFAATLGRLDGSVTRDEAISHAATIVASTALPVSADLENGFADDPEEVAETVRMAVEVGLAGCSIEDTIARLRCYQEAGADVLYAPGLTDLAQIRELVASVERPVNVLALPSAPTVGELVGAGVSRVSVGGAFAFAALGAVVEAARELQERGTYTFWEHARPGSRSAKAAFTNAASSNP